jgi:glycine cleavage system H protein
VGPFRRQSSDRGHFPVCRGQLGDVTQVDLPREGEVLKQNDAFGSVESVKAVSDLFAPVSGKVVKVNTTLQDSPEYVNEDPYDGGWMIQIELASPDELKKLMEHRLRDLSQRERGLEAARWPIQQDEFILRHIGPRPADLADMLRVVRVASLDELIDQAVPAAIRTTRRRSTSRRRCPSTRL